MLLHFTVNEIPISKLGEKRKRDHLKIDTQIQNTRSVKIEKKKNKKS